MPNRLFTIKIFDMKRLLIILAAALTLAGCEKESSGSIVGTKWETDDFGALMEYLFGYKYHVYEFERKTVSSYWLDKNGKLVSYDGDFEYTIEAPYVIIRHDENDVRKLEQLDKMTMAITTNTAIKYFKQK